MSGEKPGTREAIKPPPGPEELRSRFRELAQAIDRVHDEWQEAASREDLEAENLIAREAELLAEVEKVVRQFPPAARHQDQVVSRQTVSPGVAGGCRSPGEDEFSLAPAS